MIWGDDGKVNRLGEHGKVMRFAIIFGSALLFGLTGCASSGSSPEGVIEGLPMRSLAKGAMSGIRQAQRSVIRSPAAWRQFWDRHVLDRSPKPPPPAVDFEREMVLTVNMGMRRSGGYSVEIVEVSRKSGRIRVQVEETVPKPGSMVIMALTAPFHYVAVPRHDVPVTFVPEPNRPESP